jgi:PKD repeat protein
MKRILIFYFLLFSIYTSYSQSIYTNIKYNLSVCAGATFKISYQTYGDFPAGNEFIAQLSSPSGNFNFPIIIGTLASNASSDSISVTIPSNASLSTNYYIRVVSSNPDATSYNSKSFTIGIPPTPGAIAYSNFLCVGNTLRLNVNGTSSGNYIWSGPNGFSSTSKEAIISNITTNDAGVYSVKLQWPGGCTSSSSTATVNINSSVAPVKPTVSGNSPICSFDTLRLYASTVSEVEYEWLNPYGSRFSKIQNPYVTIYGPSAHYSSGRYAVRTVSGSCYSDTASYDVLIRSKPNILNFVVNDNKDLICAGSNIVLSVDNDGSGTSYLWTGTNGLSATGNSVTFNNVTTSGAYSLTATGTNGCVTKSVSGYILADTTTPLSSQTGSWEWARAIANKSGVGMVKEIQKDKFGNIYVSMDLNIYPSAKFTPQDSIVTYGGYDIVVAKYDSIGTFQWARHMGSTSEDHCGGMAVDETGNMFVSGAFSGTLATFGTHTLTRAGAYSNYFLTKLDNAGNFLWVKQGIDSSGLGGSSPLAIDKYGNCYFIYGSSNKFYIDGRVIEKSGFVGKFSPSGELKWTTLLKDGNTSYGRSKLSIDHNSNIYVIGASNMNPSLVKIDSSGNFLYGKIYTNLRPGANRNDNYTFGLMDIAVGNDGNVYSAMPFYYKTKPSSLIIADPPCFIVLLKTDKDGNERWHQYINEEHYSVRIGLDGLNNLYVTGNLNRNFACTSIKSNSSRSGYIAQYTPAGQLNWVKPVAAATSSTFVGCSPIYVNDDGDIFYAGEYLSDQVFGDTLKGDFSTPNWMIGKIGKVVKETIPISSFTYSQDCYPDTVSFFNTSNFHGESLQSCVWDFGDPSSESYNSSTLVNPRHKFSGEGTYTVTLTVTSTNGKTNTIQKILSIKEKPLINIHSISSSPCEGSEVAFTAAVNNFPTNSVLWNWDFADPASGEENTSTSSEVVHQFENAGTYKVQLTGDKDGCIDTVFTIININSTPSVLVTWNKPCSSEATNFYTETSDDITKWHWDFADTQSSQNYSDESNPSHQFTGVQTYPVKVVFETSSGCKDSLDNSVTVYQSPQADFSVENPCASRITYFINSSIMSNGYKNISWTISNEDIFVITDAEFFSFTSPGTYSIKLKLEDKQGCADSLTKYVDIITPEKPVIIQSNDSLITGTYISYRWYKDDIGQIDLVGNRIKVEEDGRYVVVVIDENGCEVSSNVYDYQVTGTNARMSNSLTIYPNPAKDVAFIKYLTSNSNSIQIDLIDAFGQTLLKEDINCNSRDNLLELNLNTIPTGMYYLSIKNDNQKIINKLVIQK